MTNSSAMNGGDHDDVPGTILLFDTSQEDQTGANIILQPQPSSDPEDPLNWARRRKKMAVSMVYLYTFAIGICTTAQYSILSEIAESQHLSLYQLNTGTAMMQIMQGWACLLWQPLAMTYGRRGVYVVSMALSTIPVLWTPFSSGPAQWYAHRILLGIFCSPVESLPEVSVPDVFFAHERGRYIAMYTFVLFGSNFLSPFLSGFIADGAGWRVVMYWATAIMAATTILLFLFTEETIFFRQTTEGTGRGDLITATKRTTEDDCEADGATATGHSSSGAAGTVGMETLAHRPKKTYAQKLSLISRLPGRPSRKQTFLKSWRSLQILVFFPNILWAAFLYGSNIAWYSVINATMSMILSGEPYNFPATMVGVAYLSPLLFGGVACALSGKLSDMLALRLARRNGGIREPEHRLWGLGFSAALTTGGLVMWGVGASMGAHYMVLVVGIGLVTCGVVAASAISLSYAVDCFKEISGEAFACIMVVRNTIGFSFSYAITPWIEAVGLRNCFISVSAMSFVCTCSFLGMIFWGKALRRMSAKKYWEFVALERDTAVH
ncbi:related to HOL1, putative substrate-H+ antiporter [Cephalotrichum gorgonifer]|uniref:Related to HOL1, putative substrate-H+ antiporter n=1 Tax=Cephalotrichum gorgonifer TaxID=2041049 RepID=A0AAE8SUB6_9PEZI|nr:related to HOL1, putative substrate-H+ antiporter [Cephalotrichum gorgonifer]